jgi:uroporphyrinogen decarboxylase
MISPEMYLEYAMPYEKKIVDVAHNAGVAYTLHICGNTEVILEHMLLTGADAFELDYKTDITKIYNTIRNKTTFIGNIDPSGVLALGTVDSVQKKTIELMTAYQHSNRFILNAGCALPSSTPSANLKMMIETVRRYS